MTCMPATIKSFLDEHNIPYEVIHHRKDFTARTAAQDTHTPGLDFAKTVIIFADTNYRMLLLPSTHQIDFDKIRKALNAKEVSLATEDEIASIYPDCEIGAMPPFGTLYDLPVYVSHHLAHDDQSITFNAGTHQDVIRMRYRDLADLIKPKVLDLTINHDYAL